MSDERLKAILLNDVSRAPGRRYVALSDRQKIADHLWQQGWRREERPEDASSGEPAFVRAQAVDDAAVAEEVARLGPNPSTEPSGVACACIGGPRGGTGKCFCHIRAEALASIIGKPCAWCAR